MKWYVIDPSDGCIDFTCSDDSSGVTRVLDFLKDQGKVYQSEAIILRGERYDFVPPTEEHKLRKSVR
jgi:hypothetical protein